MKFSKSVEQALLIQLKAGDIEAYTRIYKRYYNKLCRYAYSLCLDNMKAEDLVQEQLLKLWEKRKSLTIESLNAYLFKTVFNAFVDNYETERRRSTLQEKLFMEAVIEVEETDDELNKERVKILLDIIDRLPKKRREIFILCKLKNYEYKEIATIKNISVKTVESHMRKALIAIRTEIANLPPEKRTYLLLLLETIF